MELLEHKATTSAGKPVSILHGIAKNVALPGTEFVQCLSVVAIRV